MYEIKIISQCVVLVVFFFMGIVDSASGEHAMQSHIPPQMTIQDIPQEKWDKLAQKRIFFGHQSVGYNIITGIKRVLKEYPNIKIKIVKSTNIDDIHGPVLAHEWIGSNMDPKSKMKAFVEVMQDGIGEKVDIAFMKMCYVDVTAKTNVQEIFDDYKKKMSQLSWQFPDTDIVHLTVPLTAKPKGMEAVKQTGKNVIKRIMGKPTFDYKDNIKRNQLNELLKAEYGEKKPFFDLALLEAAGSDGESAVFIQDGVQIMILADNYTYDGGHLNAEGGRQIAEQLLVFLATM